MKTNLKDLMLPAPLNGGFSMEGYWVWCGSVIKGEDGKYHMFASRWSKEYPMHPGWLVASEIVRAVSDKPEGPYTFAEVVLPARGPQYWDGRSTHNPQIRKFGDEYILYYMGSTHPFPDLKDPGKLRHEDDVTVVARANKRIGVAVAKSVLGPWKRFDQPILQPRPEYFDNFFTSNPAPCIDPETGKCLMIYKTRTYLTDRTAPFLHGKMHFGLAMSDHPVSGFHQILDTPLFDGEGIEMEDPFIWKDEKGYHLIAKDMHGTICGERFGGIYAYSENGKAWTLTKECSYSRSVLWEDGVVRSMGNMERPFLLFEDGRPICAFFATSDGTAEDGFLKCTRTWNMAIPLRREI